MIDTYKDHLLDKKHPRSFFQGHYIISDQISREGLGVVWRELEAVLQNKVDGAVVELGCYIGTTSQYIRRLLDQYQDEREFHTYDSFAGLPEKVTQVQSAGGVNFVPGSLGVSKKEFVEQFKKAGLKPPIIHKSWFSELTDKDMPDTIAFAFLDGDLYRSIIDSLRLVWPRLSAGGVILIDDYKHDALPGVEQAVREFFNGKHVTIRAEHNLAIIKAAT